MTNVPKVKDSTAARAHNGPCWFPVEYPDGDSWAIFRCTAGHEERLARRTAAMPQRGHDVAADGMVSPSVVCHVAGCFHDYIRLLDWSPS